MALHAQAVGVPCRRAAAALAIPGEGLVAQLPDDRQLGAGRRAPESLEPAGDMAAVPHRPARQGKQYDRLIPPRTGGRRRSLPHRAGQHLPIRVLLPGAEKPSLRTYTLSVAPSDGVYRISVKREGAVSKYLHDTLKEGDIIEARAPAGAFTIDAGEQRPAVLLAAGVGVTPLLAMLRHLVYEGLRTRRVRRTWFIYSAHSRAERAFDGELAELAARGRRSGNARSPARAIPTAPSRVSITRRSGGSTWRCCGGILPFDDYDFYLCGPSGFMQSIHDGLRGLNVADARIHAEAFGPASLLRRADDVRRRHPGRSRRASRFRSRSRNHPRKRAGRRKAERCWNSPRRAA